MTFLLSYKKLISDPSLIDSLTNHYFTENELSIWQKFFENIDKTKALNEVEIAIDIVLILSNANMKDRPTGVNKQAFKELLTALKYTDIKE